MCFLSFVSAADGGVDDDDEKKMHKVLISVLEKKEENFRMKHFRKTPLQ